MSAHEFPAILALSLCLLATPSWAQATGSAVNPNPKVPTGSGQLLQASDPDGLADAMRDHGYRAELTTDGQGDPRIKSATAGINFSVYFYGCTDGRECDAIQFSAGFDLETGSDAPAMNDWNKRKRFGKAYIDDENDPYLEMDLNFEGGMTRDNFRDNLVLWDSLVGDFKTHINW